jgi:hypothetical protein
MPETLFYNCRSRSNGVGKTALGNALKTAYAIAGAKTVGHGEDSSLNLL